MLSQFHEDHADSRKNLSFSHHTAFRPDRIRLYRDDFGKAKEACGGTLKLPDILRCRDFKAEIFTEVYRAILAEMGNTENN